MGHIIVKDINKSYKVALRKEGLKASIKQFLKPEHKIIKALENINFEIQPGELVGYIGPNGAGKSTTVKKSVKKSGNKTSKTTTVKRTVKKPSKPKKMTVKRTVKKTSSPKKATAKRTVKKTSKPKSVKKATVKKSSSKVVVKKKK